MPHMGSTTSPSGGQYSATSRRASSGSILPGWRLEAGRYLPVRWYWALVWAHGKTASGTRSRWPPSLGAWLAGGAWVGPRCMGLRPGTGVPQSQPVSGTPGWDSHRVATTQGSRPATSDACPVVRVPSWPHLTVLSYLALGEAGGTGLASGPSLS